MRYYIADLLVCHLVVRKHERQTEISVRNRSCLQELRLVCPGLSMFLDCPLLIAPSGFSDAYFSLSFMFTYNQMTY
jgi:hypothetical protein